MEFAATQKVTEFAFDHHQIDESIVNTTHKHEEREHPFDGDRVEGSYTLVTGGEATRGNGS